ncbi:MAG TPA: hypothetical protein VFA65_17910 [Bryobacteraceae bacterium]|nr:hypothetical protein [Bryobacteraceae bacterium]
MKSLTKSLLAASLLVAPMLAGALRLEVGNPAANPEALAKHALLIVRSTACQSPEKTTITATAEGIVNGKRESIPLKLISLSAPGTFGVGRNWPDDGTWAVKMIATNPDYKNYATSAVIPVQKNVAQFEAVKHYYRAPTETDVLASLN